MNFGRLGTVKSPFARLLGISTRDPHSAAFLPWWTLLVLLAPVYMILAAIMPPADDELYYWCWSKTLQFSYYDHPGMCAYMIRLSTAVFGDSLFALRFPAAIATLTVLGVIGYLMKPRTLLPLIAITPLFTFGAVILTPDTPLLMFWALYVLWLVKVHERLDALRSEDSASRPGMSIWILGGVILGCGILGKYTTALAMMAGFVSFLIAGQWRRWLTGYIVHGVVAFLVASPILIHNIRHDFVPLLYQWKHSMGSSERSLKLFAEFVGVQLLLFGTSPFWLFGWSILKRRQLLSNSKLRVCFCLFVLPFAFFLYKAMRGRLEGNWALACYISVWPLAAVWYESVRSSLIWRRLAVSAFLPPLICVFVAGVHLAYPLPFLSPNADRITRQAAKLEVARELVKKMPEHHVENVPLFATDYQWTALLRFAGANALQVDERLTRPSHFTRNDSGPPPQIQDFPRVLVWAEGAIPEAFTAGMEKPELVDKFPLYVRGKQVTTYWLLSYSKRDPK